MYIRHYQGVAAHLGDTLAAGLGTPVDGGALTYGHIVAYLDISHLTVKLEVLRLGAHNRSRIYGAVASHRDIFEYGSVRQYLAAVTYLDVVIYECIWSDLDIVPEDCFRTYRCKWMDLVHNESVICSLPS